MFQLLNLLLNNLKFNSVKVACSYASVSLNIRANVFVNASIYQEIKYKFPFIVQINFVKVQL